MNNFGLVNIANIYPVLNRYWIYLSVGLIVFFSYLRQDIFFCDYAIIWDAAYRMSEGYVIYKDFFTPTGPVSFFLPYLTFQLFGYSFASLKIAQIGISLALAVIYKLLLDIVTQESGLKFTNYWIFLTLFVLPLGFPWYNTTALMFAFCAALMVMRGQSYWAIAVAGLLLTLSILSKQDYGLLGLLLCVGLILTKKFEFNIQSLIRVLKESYLKIALLVLISILPIAIYALVSDGFAKHFNFGSQYGGTASRLKNLFGTGTSYVFFTTIAMGIYVYYKHRSALIALSVLLLIYASVVRATSGLSHISATFYVGGLSIILYYLYQTISSKRLIIVASLFIVPLAAFMFAKPVRNFSAMANVVASPTKILTFNYNKLQADHFEKLENEFGAIYLNKASKEYVKLVSDYIQQASQQGRQLSLLNTTELTYLYHYLSISPPKGLPLWFHEGITFGKVDYRYLASRLDAESFDVVLIDKSQDFLIHYYSKNPKYQLLFDDSYLSPLDREMIAYVKK